MNTLGEVIRNSNFGKGTPLMNPTSFLIKIIGIIIVGLSLYTIYKILKERAIQKRLRESKNKIKIRLDFLNNIKVVNRYSDALKKYLKEDGLEEYYNKVFYLSLGLIVAIFLGFILVKQIFLAIISPYIILKVITKIAEKLCTDITIKMEEELPFAIDDIIRVFSKYSDLKSIIYEVSISNDGILKEIFDEMARKMMSSPLDKVLMEFGERYDNVWFYSLMFTLISYLEDASKEETLENLRRLRDLIEDENDRRQKAMEDKRITIAVSYTLVVLAFVGFILNLIFNPVGLSFFFESFVGLICFVIGVGLIIGTIFINITISKKRE